MRFAFAPTVPAKSLSERVFRLTFGMAIAALLLVGGVSYQAIRLSTESDRALLHTHDVIGNLQGIVLSMRTIESTSRGFLLTGDEAHLQNFAANIAAVRQGTAALGRLTTDNPRQQLLLPALRDTIGRSIRNTQRLNDLRRTQGFDATFGAVRTGSSLPRSYAYRPIIRRMRDEELRLLSVRTESAALRWQRAKWLLILATGLGLVIAAIAGWLVRRDGARCKIAEKTLENRDSQYRALVQGVHDYSIVMLGPTGEILSWNPGAERMTGVTGQEIVGHNFSRFFPADSITGNKPQDILRLAGEGGVHEETGVRFRKDGTRFMVRSTYTALRDPAGQLSGFSAIARDLSERTESDAKYRGLLEAAPDAMVVVNQAGDIVLVNVQAEKQFGYHRDELLGQKVKNIIPTGFAERLIADGTRTAAEALGQQIGTGIELTGRRKDGGEFPIEIMLSPLENADEILVTAAIRDISVRRDMEIQNAQLHAKLRQSEKMEAIGTLAGGVAHELNNLLQPIIMMTELVLTKLPKGTLQSRQLLQVVDAGGKAAEIVQRILAFGRADEASHDTLSVGQVVDEASAFIRTILPTSITLHIGNANVADFNDVVRGNKTQLTQILMNMATNARDAISDHVGTVWISLSRLKASDPRPSVRIGAVQAGRYIVLTVRDTGSGMDEATMTRMFEPFFTTKGVGKGTGLGLSITHGIITGHGGAMQVESAPGHGTTFSIYLPIEQNKFVLALAS